MSNLKQLQYTALSLFALVLLSLAPMEAQAQQEPGAAFVGVRGGLNQSTFSGATASSRSGFVAGVTFGYNFNEVFSMETGVSFARRGATGVTVTEGKDISNALNFNDADIRLDYYQFPFLLKLTAPLDAAVTIRGFAGPSMDFITAAAINGRKDRPNIQARKPASSRFTHVDASGILGGEIAFPLPYFEGELAIDGRYKFGFVDVDEVQQEFKYKNRAFTGAVSLRFAL